MAMRKSRFTKGQIAHALRPAFVGFGWCAVGDSNSGHADWQLRWPLSADVQFGCPI